MPIQICLKNDEYDSNIANTLKLLANTLEQFENICIWCGVKEYTPCRSRKMLDNAPTPAIVAVDTEENEPIKNEVWWVRRHFWGPNA